MKTNKNNLYPCDKCGKILAIQWAYTDPGNTYRVELDEYDLYGNGISSLSIWSQRKIRAPGEIFDIENIQVILCPTCDSAFIHAYNDLMVFIIENDLGIDKIIELKTDWCIS